MQDETKPEPVKKPKVRMNTFHRNRQTRAHKESSCWVSAPGNTEFVTKTMWDLVTVGEMNGYAGLDVTHIRVANMEGEKKVYVWPTDRNDPEALEIKQSGKKRRVNLGMFLEDCKLALPVRSREQFRLVIVAEAETPEEVPNALMFDLSAPLVQRKIGQSKKDETKEQNTRNQKNGKNTKSEKTEGEKQEGSAPESAAS